MNKTLDWLDVDIERCAWRTILCHRIKSSEESNERLLNKVKRYEKIFTILKNATDKCKKCYKIIGLLHITCENCYFNDAKFLCECDNFTELERYYISIHLCNTPTIKFETYDI